ncbi:hypothetical protein HUJ05_008328 [Dendroctonus ponderosae]|nr:hypothetical protein HUJ05_008328 [Dendroctonus ponderosae]
MFKSIIAHRLSQAGPKLPTLQVITGKQQYKYAHLHRLAEKPINFRERFDRFGAKPLRQTAKLSTNHATEQHFNSVANSELLRLSSRVSSSSGSGVREFELSGVYGSSVSMPLFARSCSNEESMDTSVDERFTLLLM